MASAPDIIVLKFGSGILTRADGVALDDSQLEALVSAVANLKKSGLRPVIVSSGAAAAGMMTFKIKERPTDLSTLQACCAVGQTRLMHFYETMFRQFGLNVAQLLVTNEDFATPERSENVANTLQRLLAFDNVVPIINENDSVAVEELKLGDNDSLSARLAGLAGADLLVLLTGVDGLKDSDNQLVSLVTDIEQAKALVRPETGTFSVGGMSTKLDAVQTAAAAGVPAIIANGRKPGQIAELVAGRGIGTRFQL
jgi:glutamate 5-kinase